MKAKITQIARESFFKKRIKNSYRWYSTLPMLYASIPTPHGTSGWHVENGGRLLGKDYPTPVMSENI